MEVIDVLDPAICRGAADRNEVEHRQMLHHFAQPDSAGMRAHGDAELRGEEQDGEVLVDTPDAAGVDLNDVDRLGLQ